jgi:hypothetical protein
VIAHRTGLSALVTAVAGALCALVALLANGGDSGVSGVLGAALVLAFFGAGVIPFLVVGDGTRSGMAFLILGMTYVLRILLGVVIYAFATAWDGLDRTATGLTVIVCALAWLNTQVVLGLSRKHRPTLDV